MFKKGFFIFAIITAALLSSLSFAVPKSEASAPIYNYDLVSQSAYPSTLEMGAITNVWIDVRNTGNTIWKNTGNQIVRLGTGSSYGNTNQNRDYASEFANSDWLSPNRPTNISGSTVAPGETTRFQFNIKVPTVSGTYKAYFTPVVDGYAWMKDSGIYWQITVKDSKISSAKPIIDGEATNPSQSSADTIAVNNVINEFAPSVVKITCDASPQYLNQGSGTLYHNTDGDPRFPEYYIATNLHVVKTDDGSVSECSIRIYPDYENDSWYLTFHSKGYQYYTQNMDFAIIEPLVNSARTIFSGSYEDLAKYAQEDTNVAKKGPLENDIGGKVIVIGYPENGDEAFTQGDTLSYEYYQGTRYIDTSALVRHGNSGGLAIDEEGNILGIPTFVRGNISMILDLHFAMNQILN